MCSGSYHHFFSLAVFRGNIRRFRLEQQKIQFAVIADLGRNLQYKYIDSSGDYLWGINFGAGVKLFGTYFSISLSIAADHESAAQITLTPEAGGSSRKFSACGCIRLMGCGENTTMDSLSGPGGVYLKRQEK